MAEKIVVISDDLDGAHLRRAQNRSVYFVRCKGKEFNAEETQEAIDYVPLFCIPAAKWEIIFGEKE